MGPNRTDELSECEYGKLQFPWTRWRVRDGAGRFGFHGEREMGPLIHVILYGRRRIKPAPRCLGPNKGAREIHRGTQTEEVWKKESWCREGPTGLGTRLRSVPFAKPVTPYAAQYMRQRYVTMQCNPNSCAWLACTLRCGWKDDGRDRRHNISHLAPSRILHIAQIMPSRLGKMAWRSIGEGKRKR